MWLFPRPPPAAPPPAVDKILAQLTERQKEIAARPLEEVSERIDFLLAVGLGYLSLDRSAATLSGGEAQRIRLATQIGSRLRGVLYVLDEPSIGLHARDNARLLGSLEQLRNLGNTVLERTEKASVRSNSFAILAIPSSSSNTTKTPFAAPISLSTSAPEPATPAATSLPKANQRKSKPPLNRLLANISAVRRRSRSPKNAAAPTEKSFKSSARAPTISKKLTSPRRPACSPSSPASPAPENPLSSTTFSIARSRRNSIAPPKRPPRTAKLSAPSTSTKSSRSIKPPSAAPRARIPPPILAFLHPSAISSRCFRNRASAATAPADSPSTSKAAAATPARGTAFAASQ